MNPSEYAKKLSGYLAAGSAAVSIALANETGVLDILYSSDEPVTSQEIAERGSLKERYVRELLGALVTAEVVKTDGESTRYHIPTDYKECLKPIAAFSRLISHFGEKFSAIKQCFQKDGPTGVRLSDFPSLFDILKDNRIVTQDKTIEEILATVEGLKENLGSGIDVGEFGCATGILINNLAGRFPNSRFLGSDVVSDVLIDAKKMATERNLKNVSFEVQDLFQLPDSYSDKFDWVFIRDTVHDLPDPQKALREIYRVLKPGGTFSMMDHGKEGTLADNTGNLSVCFWYSCSTFICIPESYQRVKSAAVGAAWSFQKAREMIKEARFTLVKENVDQASGAVHFVCVK